MWRGGVEPGCVPGCTGRGTSWCDDTACQNLRLEVECAWRPLQLAAFLEKQDRCNPYGHNEVVIKPTSMLDALPNSVLGIFYMVNSNEDERQQAIRAHALFLADHAHLNAADFPLLIYDSGKDSPDQEPTFIRAPQYERPCEAAVIQPGETHARCQTPQNI